MPNPFVHIELNTRDLPRARAFYSKIFKWKLTDLPEMGYTMLDAGTSASGSPGVGGGMAPTQHPEAPSAWLAYVEVADLAATVARARKAGAEIVIEHMPIPDMGAIAVLIDPTGAQLGLWQPAAPAPAPKKAAEKGAKPAKKAAKRPGKKAARKAAKAAAKPAAKRARR